MKFPYPVGTMIEVPRGALTADAIAGVAEFFSFGTNDLTQTTLGVSRDDAGRFLAPYVDEFEIYARDPFESIDQDGRRRAHADRRREGPRRCDRKLKIGICGEHGGEPASVRVLPPRRPRLRLVLAVPGADRPARGGAGGDSSADLKSLARSAELSGGQGDPRVTPCLKGKSRMGRRERARLFGVLGDPVEHSLSPAMQNAAFAAARLPHLYLRYRVAPGGLAHAFDEARRLGMGGLNLTVPLKEAVLPLVDELSPAAARIGAVNTVVFRGSRLRGDNTDARGFLRSLAGRVRLRGATAVIIGAGGAARAVGAALVDGGIDRDRRRESDAWRGRRPSAARSRRWARRAPRPYLSPRLPTAPPSPTSHSSSTRRRRASTAAVHASASPRRRRAACSSIWSTARAPHASSPAPRGPAGRRSTAARMLLHQGALAFEAWTGRRRRWRRWPHALDRCRAAIDPAAAPPARLTTTALE